MRNVGIEDVERFGAIAPIRISSCNIAAHAIGAYLIDRLPIEKVEELFESLGGKRVIASFISDAPALDE